MRGMSGSRACSGFREEKMLDFIKAVIYGIIEGITEWLPISSTGHLILAERFLPFEGTSENFFNVFDVVIQLGAIMAVVILFWNTIWPFAFSKANKTANGGSVIKKDTFILWVKMLISCVPAAIIGIALDDFVEEHFYNPLCIAIALIVFGIAFIVIETLNKGKEPKTKSVFEITFTAALIIGIFQVLAAVFPGTSRSGATIIGALMIGIARTAAAEYTFILAIPVMFGASLLKVVKYGLNFQAKELALLATGCVVAFAVSMLVIRFLLGFIKKFDFKPFGWYRIALGALVIALFIAKVI